MKGRGAGRRTSSDGQTRQASICYNRFVKIILVTTDTSGRNVVFTSDQMKAHSLEEATKLATKGMLDGIHVVRSGAGSYLRSNPNTVEHDDLDAFSVSSHKLFASLDDLSVVMPLQGFRLYFKLYKAYLKSREKEGETMIMIDGYPRMTREHVTEKLAPHRTLVFDAAAQFSIDPYLLGGIIIDEIARASMFEEILDVLLPSFIGWNASAGIAQVKMETARGLIKSDYYNPNTSDKKLSKENIGQTSRSYLYTYVVKPKHSIYFAAARMRALIDEWESVGDIGNKPEIIATLYSRKYKKPNPDPQPTARGLQIAGEFYRLAKEILRSL